MHNILNCHKFEFIKPILICINGGKFINNLNYKSEMNSTTKEAAMTFLLATASFVVAQIIFAQVSAKFPAIAGK